MSHDVQNKIASDAARAIAQKKDSLLRDLVTERLKRADWTLAELDGRLRIVKFEGQPQELWLLDDRALLEYYPPEAKVEHRGNEVHLNVTSCFRTFERKGAS